MAVGFKKWYLQNIDQNYWLRIKIITTPTDYSTHSQTNEILSTSHSIPNHSAMIQTRMMWDEGCNQVKYVGFDKIHHHHDWWKPKNIWCTLPNLLQLLTCSLFIRDSWFSLIGLKKQYLHLILNNDWQTQEKCSCIHRITTTAWFKCEDQVSLTMMIDESINSQENV